MIRRGNTRKAAQPRHPLPTAKGLATYCRIPEQKGVVGRSSGGGCSSSAIRSTFPNGSNPSILAQNPLLVQQISRPLTPLAMPCNYLLSGAKHFGSQNGLQNGSQNGIANGMQNGSQNGIVNGRQNGNANGMPSRSQNGSANGLLNGSQNRIANGMQSGIENGSQSRMQNGIVNGMQNGMKNGSQKEFANGIQNGRQNGIANGIQSGMQNGIANGTQNAIQSGMQNGIVNGMKNGTLPYIPPCPLAIAAAYEREVREICAREGNTGRFSPFNSNSLYAVLEFERRFRQQHAFETGQMLPQVGVGPEVQVQGRHSCSKCRPRSIPTPVIKHSTNGGIWDNLSYPMATRAIQQFASVQADVPLKQEGATAQSPAQAAAAQVQQEENAEELSNDYLNFDYETAFASVNRDSNGSNRTTNFKKTEVGTDAAKIKGVDLTRPGTSTALVMRGVVRFWDVDLTLPEVQSTPAQQRQDDGEVIGIWTGPDPAHKAPELRKFVPTDMTYKCTLCGRAEKKRLAMEHHRWEHPFQRVIFAEVHPDSSIWSKQKCAFIPPIEYRLTQTGLPMSMFD